MKTNENIFQELELVRKLIEDAKTNLALNELTKIKNIPHRNIFQTLLGQYNDLRIRRNAGVITEDNYSSTLNKIHYSILDTIQIIQDSLTQGESIDNLSLLNSKPFDSIKSSDQRRAIYIDKRDNQQYNLVRFDDDKWWFAENLRFDIEGSWCYDDNLDSCKKFGRLYNWEVAMKACPEGWVLPSEDDWIELAESFNCFFDTRNGKRSGYGKTSLSIC